MIEFRLPSLGADMDEGMLVGWLVSPGDPVHRGQVIAEVESDKGIIEVECWDDGVVAELLVQPGPDRLAVGTPLAMIRPAEEAAAPPAEMPAPAAAPPPERPAPTPPAPSVSPPVRHLAHELGVDLGRVRPTGPGGSITRDDVQRAAEAPRRRVRASPMARRLAGELGVDLAAVEPARADGLIGAEDVRAASGVETARPPAEAGAEAAPPERTGERAEAMRRAIARSMARSNREIPHYYVAGHLDLASALGWLDEYNAEVPVTARILPAALLLKATALALRAFPDLNGRMVDDTFQRSDDIHLGVAVSLREGGLVAPAIHHADRLALAETMESLRDLVTRARAWRLRSSEMSDPTITVTNLGDRGTETVFPVIIPPQVAIVGFGRIVDRPAAVDGMLAVRPTVHATLAADHRVTDGHLGALFVEELGRLLQEPERL